MQAGQRIKCFVKKSNGAIQKCMGKLYKLDCRWAAKWDIYHCYNRYGIFSEFDNKTLSLSLSDLKELAKAPDNTKSYLLKFSKKKEAVFVTEPQASEGSNGLDRVKLKVIQEWVAYVDLNSNNEMVKWIPASAL